MCVQSWPIIYLYIISLNRYKQVYLFLLDHLMLLFSAGTQAHVGVDPCGNGKPLVIDNSVRGEILSPNYPKPYPISKNCQWHIRVASGYVVLLTVVDFNVENA